MLTQVSAPAEQSAAKTQEVLVVIDDDYAMRLSCRQILARMGFDVETFDNGAAGLEGVARLRPPLVVVDLKMPGISGLDVIEHVHELDPEIVIIVITGYATIATAVDAIRSGAYDFLPKPFSPDELRLIVARGLERRRLRHESQRYQLERELLRHKFVTFVSHELKTPLVAIHQYLDVLRRLGDSPDAAAHRAEWLERCLHRTEDLQALIHDWLTLAQAEGGALVRAREPVDVAALVAQALQICEPLAASAGISLRSTVGPGEVMLEGDAHAIGVLLDNLISNAIKYNRPGGRVHVRAAALADGVEIAVEDTGLGIPADALPYLFDEFFRVGGEHAAKTSGTGLGLPICKHIVEEMGGTIKVSSDPGRGSTFTLRLPTGSAQPTQPGAME